MSSLPPGKFQQRSSIPSLAPPWLNDTESQKYIYLFTFALDMLLEKQNQAMRAHMPTQAPPSALPILGNDRLLVQGPAETNDAFAGRLQSSFDAWSIAGSRRSVLNQLQAYLANLEPGLSGSLPSMLIVGGGVSATTWDTVYLGDQPGSVPAHAYEAPANWTWTSNDPPYQSWLVMFFAADPTGLSGTNAVVHATGGSGVTGVTSGFATINGLSSLTSANVQGYLTLTGCIHSGNNGTFQIASVLSATSCIIANSAAVPPDTASAWSISAYPFLGPAPVWGSPSANWGTSSWGVLAELNSVIVSPQVVTSIRQILGRWKGPAIYPNMVFCFGGGDSTAGFEFSPNSSPGSGNPDGTWGPQTKVVGGAWVPARFTGVPLGQFDAFADGTLIAVNCFVYTKG